MKYEELEVGMTVQDIVTDDAVNIGIVIESANIHDVVVLFDEEEGDVGFYCFDEECHDYNGDDLVEYKTNHMSQLSNSLKNLHKK
jgi:hypothetical protein